MKFVINDVKNKKSYQKEVPDDKAALLYGKKVGDAFEGQLIEVPGYQMTITGGSNKDGFPMRPELAGQRKQQLWLAHAPGVRGLKKGERRMRTVVGNQISKETSQLNVKVTEYGPKTLEELGMSAPGKKKEDKEKK